MTHSHDLPPIEGQHPRDWHVHRGVAGLWSVSATLHQCRHIRVTLGRLETTSHRMVWYGHAEQDAGDHPRLEALIMMRDLLNGEMQDLQTPPW